MKGTTSLTSYWKDFTVQKKRFLHDVAVFAGETIFSCFFSLAAVSSDFLTLESFVLIDEGGKK